MKTQATLGLALLLLPAWAAAQGYLENPQPNVIESGIGLISGWHCTARDVTVYVNGTYIGRSGVGSLRTDTTALCGGKSENGFSLLYNFNVLPPGEHRIEVRVDGAPFTTRTFRTVRSGGVEFLQGVAREVQVENFPVQGSTATLTWSQAKQSFVVTGFVQPATPQSDACNKTAMATGTWSFHYTVVSAFSGRFSFSGTPVATGDPDFPCMLMGTDEYGNRDVSASYIISLGEWLFLDQGSLFDRAFLMRMTTPTRMDGRYHQYKSGSFISGAYTAYALKTAGGSGQPGVLSVPLPPDELSQQQLEQAEQAVVAPLQVPQTPPPDVRRMLERARDWLRHLGPAVQ
jgi:hypothetical protein